jgi:hypothetical protein
VQKWAQDFRRWMGEKIGAQVERPTERVQRSVRISATLPRQRPDEPRQSRGYRM